MSARCCSVPVPACSLQRFSPRSSLWASCVQKGTVAADVGGDTVPAARSDTRRRDGKCEEGEDRKNGDDDADAAVVVAVVQMRPLDMPPQSLQPPLDYSAAVARTSWLVARRRRC